MTSLRQVEANRRNARKSTGPRTKRGKEQSRRNAVRHGLTAETLNLAAERTDAYAAHETALIASIKPESAIERELALYLASLLWRLKRATQFETGLLQIQHDIITEMNGEQADTRADGEQPVIVGAPTSLVLQQTLRTSKTNGDRAGAQNPIRNGYRALDPSRRSARQTGPSGDPTDARQAARAFLRLARLDNDILERLTRYEAKLWRRALQAINTLSILRRTRMGA